MFLFFYLASLVHLYGRSSSQIYPNVPLPSLQPPLLSPQMHSLLLCSPLPFSSLHSSYVCPSLLHSLLLWPSLLHCLHKFPPPAQLTFICPQVLYPRLILMFLLWGTLLQHKGRKENKFMYGHIITPPQILCLASLKLHTNMGLNNGFPKLDMCNSGFT